jgi:hypothetical protein
LEEIDSGDRICDLFQHPLLRSLYGINKGKFLNEKGSGLNGGSLFELVGGMGKIDDEAIFLRSVPQRGLLFERFMISHSFGDRSWSHFTSPTV